MKEKRCIVILVVCLFLLTGCGKGYVHELLVSETDREDCFLCGDREGLSGDETGDLGILNLNTMELLRMELRQTGEEEELEVSMHALDGSIVETTAYPARGYAYGQIIGSRYSLDRNYIRKNLCQVCLDMINETDFRGEAPTEYVFVNFSEHSIRVPVKGVPWMRMGDFKIGCAFEEDGTIKLLIQNVDFLSHNLDTVGEGLDPPEAQRMDTAQGRVKTLSYNWGLQFEREIGGGGIERNECF